jgi:hypothetical protein
VKAVHQPAPVDHRNGRDDPVEVLRIALRQHQCFATSFGAAEEILQLGFALVKACNQDVRAVLDLLVRLVCEVQEHLVVQCELCRVRGVVVRCIVARVGAEGDVSQRHGHRQPVRGIAQGSQAVDEHAVEATAAIHQGLFIPRQRKIQLKFDRFGC